jgi:hypothetical protein
MTNGDKTEREIDEEISAALDEALARIQSDSEVVTLDEPPAEATCSPPVVSFARAPGSALPDQEEDEEGEEADPEFQRFMEWVETSPKAKRRRKRPTYFLTTTQRYNIGVLGVGQMVYEVHSTLAARFKKQNEREGPQILYSTREFEMQRYQSHGEKVSPLVLAARGYRPNFFVIVQSAKSLAELPPAGIDDLAMRCCQAANPRHDIDPFHTAFVVRAQFEHFEPYQRRTAGKPWCAVGQFSMDPQGMDELEAVIARTATHRLRPTR